MVNITDSIKISESKKEELIKFIVEKQVEGNTTWTATVPFDKNLSGVPTWQDTNTAAGKNITYIVGFKNPSVTFGYIYLENNSTSSLSEGGMGLDNTYKGHPASYWAYQNSTKVFNIVSSTTNFMDCFYDSLVSSTTTSDLKDEAGNIVGTVKAEPISVFGADNTFTKLTITFTGTNPYDSAKPFRGAVIGGRLLLFKVIAPPTIEDIASVIFS